MSELTHTIKCIELNPNSINSKVKQHELGEFIVKLNPDVMLIVETKLKPNKKVAFRNYNMFRNDRATDSGGGTAILVKSKYVSTHEKCIPTIVTFEYTAIKATLENGN